LSRRNREQTVKAALSPRTYKPLGREGQPVRQFAALKRRRQPSIAPPPAPPRVKSRETVGWEILERAREDERRHCAWILAELEKF